MEVVSQQFEMVEAASLKPHPDNPQEGDREAIAESIAENGFFGYVIVQKSTNRVIAGWHRCAEAVKAGVGEIPAMVIDCDDDRAKRMLLADNRTSARMRGSTRQDRLAQNLQEIMRRKGSIAGTGYTNEFFASLKAKQSPPPPPEDEEKGGGNTMQVKIGISVAKLRCYVYAADFREWESKIKTACGFDKNKVAQEIKQRLGIGIK